MKKIILVFFCLTSILLAYGQSDASDYGKISINAIQPDYPDVPEEAREYLETKMRQVIATYGLADNGLNERFVMTAKIAVLSKDVTPTTPVKISQKIEITFIIGDVVDNKIYETATLSAAGIGQSETKCLMQAFQRIQPTNPALKKLIESAQQKIATYYSNNCASIISEASVLENSQQYDAAIAKLMTVPNVCAECFDKCQKQAIAVFNRKIDQEGKTLIQQARSAWSVKHDYECAEKALEILSKINPDAQCADEAHKMVKEINDHLRKVEAQQAAAAAARAKAAWEFKMRKYEDDLADRRQAHADRTALIGQAISGFTQVGTMFGKHQPLVRRTNVTNLIRRW